MTDATPIDLGQAEPAEGRPRVLNSNALQLATQVLAHRNREAVAGFLDGEVQTVAAEVIRTYLDSVERQQATLESGRYDDKQYVDSDAADFNR